MAGIVVSEMNEGVFKTIEMFCSPVCYSPRGLLVRPPRVAGMVVSEMNEIVFKNDRNVLFTVLDIVLNFLRR